MRSSGLVAGVAEHQALVARAAVSDAIEISGDCDWIRLCTRRCASRSRKGRRYSPHRGGAARDLGHVDVGVRKVISRDDAGAGGDQDFTGPRGPWISGEHGVEDRVGDLVGDLIGMAFGDGFRGKNVSLSV